MTNEADNPYQPPMTAARGGRCRYGDLPRTCPQCERRFSDTLFNRLYPRRHRLGAKCFIVLVTLGFLVFGWLWIFAFLPLGGWAMTWPKKVRMKCSSCNWAQTFIVSGRG